MTQWTLLRNDADAHWHGQSLVVFQEHGNLSLKHEIEAGWITGIDPED
jgi:hypothetical protein